MKAVDLDGTGFIDVAEFRGAALLISTSITEDQIKYAFSYFDRNDSGILRSDDILQAVNVPQHQSLD
jgi:Ca2+-binding EF-hand superfamily protein